MASQVFQKLPRRKNLFDLLRVLPNSGIGSKVGKPQWGEGCYWEITRIKIDPDGSHGKVWGTPYWRGQAKPTAKGDTRIPGPLKTFWVMKESNLLPPGAAAWVSEDWSAVRQQLSGAESGGEEGTADSSPDGEA
ncbi:uncharacterized protein LOC142355027 [Convolutriloba macropyga]|uniref:uncharacterized protein LOC142355027 n=1 Tax=Convolutriloba macropyga TaxID=536237 RepID=UPI003F527E1C